MKTYTFFYYDSFSDFRNVRNFKSYCFTSFRFDFAFKSFCNFLSLSDSDFVEFCYSYNVFNGFKTQVRSLSYNDILHLKDIVCKHNSNSKEIFQNEI